MLDTNVPVPVESVRAGNESEAKRPCVREGLVVLDLADGLARHADCTCESGLIAAEQGKCIGLSDWRLFLHG